MLLPRDDVVWSLSDTRHDVCLTEQNVSRLELAGMIGSQEAETKSAVSGYKKMYPE
jgi:hypothetical protein